MKKMSTPITFSGRVRLKSLIVIRQEMPFTSSIFDIVKGKWQLPESHHPVIERPEIMQDIESKIGPQNANHQFTHTLRLCGERGIGKTHLAMQLAHSHYRESRFQSIVWLNVNDNNQDSLEAQWMYLCAGLGLEITEKNTFSEVIALAYQKIMTYGNALFIFDGVEDYQSIEPYLKFNNPSLTLLITSRNGIAWGYNDSHYELKPFTEEQAIAWLEKLLQQHNIKNDKELNRNLVHSVHCHPLRLQELATLITFQAGATEQSTMALVNIQTVKFQSNVDINAIEQDEFAFRFLQYCALLCPYQEVSLDFFYLLYDNKMNFDVTEAIFLLKQHGLIGYPPQSSQFYMPSILANIALKELNNAIKANMITELLQVSLKMLAPANVNTIMRHMTHLVELFIDIMNTRPNNNQKGLPFFQNSNPCQLLKISKDFHPTLVKFIERYNQILTSNNIAFSNELTNATNELREAFQQKVESAYKCDL